MDEHCLDELGEIEVCPHCHMGSRFLHLHLNECGENPDNLSWSKAIELRRKMCSYDSNAIDDVCGNMEFCVKSAYHKDGSVAWSRSVVSCGYEDGLRECVKTDFNIPSNWEFRYLGTGEE